MKFMDEEWVAELLRLMNDVSVAFDATLKPEERAALAAAHASETEPVYPTADREVAMLEFAAGGLETLVNDMHSVIDQRLEVVYRQALETYYEIERLARDPQHAHLIEQVEKMQRAHQDDYGRPIPPREGE